jgi:hypothetical protein
MATTYLMGEQISMRGMFMPWLRVLGRRLKRILCDSVVMEMNPAVMTGTEQTELNLQLANLSAIAAGGFLDRQHLNPCVMKGTGRIKVEIIRIGSKRINMRRQMDST